MACIVVFSSTEYTTALSPGSLRYSPHTSAALSQNSGSREVSHEVVFHGLRSRSVSTLCSCESEIPTVGINAACNADNVQCEAPAGGDSHTAISTARWVM